jgi:DNA-binding NarL/FixJ family response regulator
MSSQLDRIEWKLDQLLMHIRAESGTNWGVTRPPPQPVASAGDVLRRFTTKQHACLQMLLRGAGNQEIADRFGVTDNTAKVYVRSIAAKLKVQTRSQIVIALLDAFHAIDDATYRLLTGGLPKDWDAEYSEPDPFAHLYRRDDA